LSGTVNMDKPVAFFWRKFPKMVFILKFWFKSCKLLWNGIFRVCTCVRNKNNYLAKWLFRSTYEQRLCLKCIFTCVLT
jgi:hypothetical protein